PGSTSGPTVTCPRGRWAGLSRRRARRWPLARRRGRGAPETERRGMDFEFTAEETAFRAELVRFLDEEMAPWWRHIFCHTERSTEAGLAMAGKLAERGWLTMSWPEEYGGSASSAWTQVVLREEMWARGEPRGPQYMNVNYIGPMIMKFGSEEQKRRFLTPMSRGEVLWCQGFSEPGAGSDLSAVATRARWSPEEGGYRVDGQKIWTSYA